MDEIKLIRRHEKRVPAWKWLSKYAPKWVRDDFNSFEYEDRQQRDEAFKMALKFALLLLTLQGEK